MPYPLAAAAAVFSTACPPSLIPSWIQDINTLAGLISFAMTVGVWWQVRNVRLSFRTRARLPQLVDDLRLQRQLLEDMLGTAPLPAVGVQRTLATAGALLGHALPVAPRRTQHSVHGAMRALALAAHAVGAGAPPRGRELAAAFGALCTAEVDLNQVSLDLNWT